MGKASGIYGPHTLFSQKQAVQAGSRKAARLQSKLDKAKHSGPRGDKFCS